MVGATVTIEKTAPSQRSTAMLNLLVLLVLMILLSGTLSKTAPHPRQSASPNQRLGPLEAVAMFNTARTLWMGSVIAQILLLLWWLSLSVGSSPVRFNTADYPDVEYT